MHLRPLLLSSFAAAVLLASPALASSVIPVPEPASFGLLTAVGLAAVLGYKLGRR
jgi:hypothetical protein